MRGSLEDHRTCQKPWMILGDFNSILTPEDRICGNPVSQSEVVDFHNCVKEYELIQLPHIGTKYT